MNRFLRHLFVSSLFDIFLFLATAISIGVVAYSFISFHILLISVIIVISFFFITYKLYSAYYVDYQEHQRKIAHEISEIESEIIMLKINDMLAKNKKLTKVIKKEIRKKKRFIEELKKEKI